MNRIALVLLIVLLSACAPTPTATPVPPPPTQVPPTATRIPPTATPVPPTATLAPTATQVPPTTAPTATRIVTPTTVAAATAVPAPTFAPNAVCATQGTLEQLIACVLAKMPRRDTQGYVAPPANLVADFKPVAAQMLAGKCDDIALPASMAKIYSIATFTDKQNNASYCVALETDDANVNGTIDRAWGTFIVNPKATRELSIQAPHPLADLATEAQAIAVFKGVNARSYVLAGSHRDANKERTTCQPSTNEGVADAAHNVSDVFHAATEALNEFYKEKDWNAIQFHGMGTTSCAGVDVFLSYGVQTAPKPTDKIVTLRDNFVKQQPKLVATVFGENPPCNLYATTNVQGRLLNNVPAAQVCHLPATSYTGKFIHIEQKTNSRAAVADWIAAINATWK